MKKIKLDNTLCLIGSGKYSDGIEGACIVYGGWQAAISVFAWSNPITATANLAIWGGCAINAVTGRIWNY